MDTARREGVSRATRLAGKTHCTRCARGASFGPVLVKRRNKAKGLPHERGPAHERSECFGCSECFGHGRFTSRPEGAPQMIWHRVAALEKGMPGPAPRAGPSPRAKRVLWLQRVLWVFSTGCVGMPHHLFQVTWGALYPPILGCSTTNRPAGPLRRATRG
jgi:hypothetical protein